MCQEYEFELEPITVAHARYGMLPDCFRDLVHKYYCDKTDLKDKKDDAEHSAVFYELLYNKMKNVLNALYGMLAQDINICSRHCFKFFLVILRSEILG